MRNPFAKRVDGDVECQAVDVQSRLEMVASFDLEQCCAAFEVSGLQKSVQAGVARRLRWLQRNRVLHAEAAVLAFNNRYPIGTRVRYWSGAREGAGVESATRTYANVLSGHTAVVWVDGRGACVALSHVEVLE